MTESDIALLRLSNQHIADSDLRKPVDVVRSLLAVQAQDFLGSLWAIGLRMKESNEEVVEQAVNKKEIVRTWPMRGTIHFLAAEDAKWMLDLLAPRIVRRMDYYYKRAELNQKIFDQTKQILIKHLSNQELTRPEIYSIFEKEGISTKNMRGLHIMGLHSLTGLVCFGNRKGKQATFALLDDCIPKTKSKSREEALAEVTYRFFTGHGPAQIIDLMWWSGLNKSEVLEGLSIIKSRLISEKIDGKEYWMDTSQRSVKQDSDLYMLATYDEYLIAYKDRSVSLEEMHKQKINPGSNGMFLSTLVLHGQVIGLWRRDIKKKEVIITAKFFKEPNTQTKDKFEQTAQRYGKFLQLPTKIVIDQL